MGTVVEISSASLASSKSILNRALIVQSFFPELKLHYNQNFLREDVLHLRDSLKGINQKGFRLSFFITSFKFTAQLLVKISGC